VGVRATRAILRLDHTTEPGSKNRSSGSYSCPIGQRAFPTGEAEGFERAGLVIDPGPRPIRGKNTSGPAYAFDTGTFMGTPVYLGELRTDEAGRLIFLGGGAAPR
jgi:hypothetical protein